jgi:hypothetical protein
MSKITRAKRAGGVAQVVECLLSKCKALSSKQSKQTNERISIIVPIRNNLNLHNGKRKTIVV